ncbi:MAG: YigZ family protein [Bacteroidales bacterium]|nr:YigZ family protein [Bacteroidales bacterium]
MAECIEDSYSTLAAPSQGIFRSKGSRFLAFAYPVQSEAEIKKHLEEIKKQYFDARHHCYAYKLGLKGDLSRANDDGEPSGTAGKPILGQIDSFGVTHVLVIVVRYFGGVLLGTGGLVEAYKEAAADALRQAEIVTRLVYDSCEISFPYEQMNEVMRLIKDAGLNLIKMESGIYCTLEIKIRKRNRFPFSEKLKLIKSLQQNWR